MSNHSEAKKYMAKARLLGINPFELELLDNDRVMLTQVTDKESTGKIVIPSFITQTSTKYDYYRPFTGCKFSEIYIDNKENTFEDISVMLSSLSSTSIKFGMSHSENIKCAYGLFELSSSLKSVQFTDFNTKNITSIQRMFASCFELEQVDLSGFDTRNVIQMEQMFSLCSRIKSLDLSSFRTTSILNAKHMFYNCKQLKYLDISGFELPDFCSYTGMFYGCESLIRVNLGIMREYWKRTGMLRKMFEDCPHLFI